MNEIDDIAELQGQVIDLEAQVAGLTKMLEAAKMADVVYERDASASPADFQRVVAEIRSRDRCSGPIAMSKARKEFPDLYKAAFREFPAV